MVFKHKNGANIPKNKWVMGLLSTLGVREFEPKCADTVSDEILPYHLLNDADVGNNNLV